MAKPVNVVFSVPHASTETPAGDAGSYAIATSLQEKLGGIVLAPRADGKFIPRTGKDDYNRRTTPWEELKTTLDEHPNAKLIDVHTYGDSRIPRQWEGKIKNLSSKLPIMIVMTLEGQDQLYKTFFQDYPRIAGSRDNRNVGLAPERAVLLEFNARAHEHDYTKDFNAVVETLKHFIDPLALRY